MQHLIDFIHEHTLDENVYLVVESTIGECELTWNRHRDGECWRLRPKATPGDGANAEGATDEAAAAEQGEGWTRVPRAELIERLRGLQVNMRGFEAELRAIVTTQIVFADMVLADARKALGRDAVRRAVLSHRDFVGELNAALQRLVPKAEVRDRMAVIHGDGHATKVRRGHLSLVT